ncbi:MAG: ABC transporter ATP-binding protein [Clostridiales Family XIII bacterium]|jgi:ABC-2 type transport system ATP-binding protein|nr:ABC transporter ATP-binding protein [Clostridiales Family XIII bacterium]
MNNEQIILKTRGLTKRFGGLDALNDINLDIYRGRIIGLLGPNGSGKSTLIKLANGLLQPTSGSIEIAGQRPGPYTKSIVSYLPDRSYFDDWMKVSDCLKLFADFYADFNVAKAYEMLKLLDIDEKKMFRTLSKGTKEKVQLVLVMSRQASLYLLDEPIGGVDPATRDYILSTIINNYNEEGTVIISTHLIADIEKVLDEVIFLNRGKVERYMSVDDMRETTGQSVDEVFREVYRC